MPGGQHLLHGFYDHSHFLCLDCGRPEEPISEEENQRTVAVTILEVTQNFEFRIRSSEKACRPICMSKNVGWFGFWSMFGALDSWALKSDILHLGIRAAAKPTTECCVLLPGKKLQTVHSPQESSGQPSHYCTNFFLHLPPCHLFSARIILTEKPADIVFNLIGLLCRLTESWRRSGTKKTRTGKLLRPWLRHYCLLLWGGSSQLVVLTCNFQ